MSFQAFSSHGGLIRMLKHKKKDRVHTVLFYGAPGRIRTGDLRVTNALLCLLSHGSGYGVLYH